jgi:hypothetical protein
MQVPFHEEFPCVEIRRHFVMNYLVPSYVSKDKKTFGNDTRSASCGKFGIDKENIISDGHLIFQGGGPITCRHCSVSETTVLRRSVQLCIKCHLKKWSSDRLEWIFQNESCGLNNDSRCAFPHFMSVLLSQTRDYRLMRFVSKYTASSACCQDAAITVLVSGSRAECVGKLTLQIFVFLTSL